MVKATVNEGSSIVPRVEKDEAETGEILHISRHHGEIMFKRRCGDQAVRSVERFSSELASSVQGTPTVAYPLGHRQDSVSKQG